MFACWLIKTGILYRKKDGSEIRIYFRLLNLCCDLPEIQLILSMYVSWSGNRPVPNCVCLHTDLLIHDGTGNCRNPVRLVDDDDDKWPGMRSIYLADAGATRTEEAKQFSFSLVQSAIWKATFETGISAYELHDPDTLHLFWQGLAKTFLQDTLVIIKRLGGEEAVRALDFRAMRLHRYPHSRGVICMAVRIIVSIYYRFYGFKNFMYRISDLEKLTGNEMRHIASVLYLLLDGVCDDDSNRSVAKGVFETTHMFSFVTATFLYVDVFLRCKWCLCCTSSICARRRRVPVSILMFHCSLWGHLLRNSWFCCRPLL